MPREEKKAGWDLTDHCGFSGQLGYRHWVKLVSNCNKLDFKIINTVTKPNIKQSLSMD